MDRNTINPGLKAGLAVKMFHPAKYFEKNVLSGIRGIRRVCQNAVNHAVNWLMEFSDQPRVRVFRPCFQFLDQSRFLRADSDCACKLAQIGRSRHSCHGGTPQLYSRRKTPPALLDPAAGAQVPET